MNYPDPVIIEYIEMRAIVDLMESHIEEFKDKLKLMLAFGDLVTSGNTYDVDLLEVIDGWDGPSQAIFPSTTDFPLRGQLRLHILTPQEFENAHGIEDSKERDWALQLLESVRKGFKIIYENPSRYLDSVWNRAEIETTGIDPRTLRKRAANQ